MTMVGGGFAGGQGADVNVAGEGVFMTLSCTVPGVVGTANLATNATQTTRFILPFRIVVRRVVFEVTTLSVGEFVGFGIYNSDGTVLLVDSGPVSTTTTGVKSVTLASPVTLEPGVYICAWTQESATILVKAYSLGTGAAALLNANNPNVAVGNLGSAGQLPATTGTLTNSTGNSPYMSLET